MSHAQSLASIKVKVVPFRALVRRQGASASSGATAGRVDTHGCSLSKGLILDVGPPLGVRLRVGARPQIAQTDSCQSTEPLGAFRCATPMYL